MAASLQQGDAHGPFVVVALSPEVLELAANLAGIRGLRAYDSVQFASALAARAAEPSLDRFACFDVDLRAFAAADGFICQP
jgi:predicted nucleic acid-binding protein